MKYYKEAEEKRKREKYFKWNNLRIKKADENLEQSIRSIRCQKMQNCKNRETKVCFYCISNKDHFVGQNVGNYYKPKIPGMKFF